MDATLVRETLAGYAAANEVIEAERIEWLANLSNDEARAIDRSLYASWDGFPAWTKVGLERLEPLQLEGLLTIRQAFAQRSRVILVRAGNGCPVDISLGLPGYEDEVMQRAVAVELEPGKAVRICSAEDLIIHKAIAGRPQDVRDVEGIVYRQRDGLDAAYIRYWLQAFADLLDNPEIVQRFESPWQRIHMI